MRDQKRYLEKCCPIYLNSVSHVCPAICRWCVFLELISATLAGDSTFLTFIHSSLPLLRVLLTTAHTQVCTVIRFSQSRFVPTSKLLIPLFFLSGCWPVETSADREAKHSSSVFPFGFQFQALLNSHLFFPQQFFPVLSFFFRLSIFWHVLYHFSLFFSCFCCFLSSSFLHLRWSSLDMTMAFFLENSPTPFRDDF